FLVRSGVLSSVHAFASDPQRGLYILALLTLAIGASLALFAWRAPRLAAIPAFSWLSRESLLLLNNLFLLVSAATILLGTLYPMLLEALHLGSISVGPPYFETVFVPLMAPLLTLAAAAPFTTWRQTAPARLWLQLRWPLLAALGLGLLLSLSTLHSMQAALGLCLGLWVLLGTLWHAGHALKPGPGASLLQAWHRTPRATVGMWTAHLGLAVFVLGVSLVRTLEYSQDLRLNVGRSATVGDYQFRLAGLTRRDGPNYLAARADIEVRPARDPQAKPVLLHPEKRFFPVQAMPMTEAGIDRGFSRDLYVSLAELGADQSWGMRIQVKPFMSWLWCGVLLMALGGFVAAADRRLRLAGRTQACAQQAQGLPLALSPQGARA
ncbi:MAG: c-type cytochrome biogenesis protein CcmF, partial [Paucibacter sp.]|nr:c-type cytochrome biogenesis protein CcmF [Roseateles sp.]